MLRQIKYNVEDQLNYGSFEGIGIDEALGLSKLNKLDDIFELMSLALKVKLFFKGKTTIRCLSLYLPPSKCAEDCNFCVLSTKNSSNQEIDVLTNLKDIITLATKAEKDGVTRIKLVSSEGGVKGKYFDFLLNCFSGLRRVLKESTSLCASVGLLKDEQTALALKKAGVVRYNSNFETSIRLFPTLCSTQVIKIKLMLLT